VPQIWENLHLGDFNIHMNTAITKEVLSVLECLWTVTHREGHTIDLGISNGSCVSQLSTSDLGLFGHLADINISPSRIIHFCKWISIELWFLCFYSLFFMLFFCICIGGLGCYAKLFSLDWPGLIRSFIIKFMR